MGRHTKRGGYLIDWNKVRTFVVPDLTDFTVSIRPLAAFPECQISYLLSTLAVVSICVEKDYSSTWTRCFHLQGVF
jgi:hypothetical protein